MGKGKAASKKAADKKKPAERKGKAAAAALSKQAPAAASDNKAADFNALQGPAAGVGGDDEAELAVGEKSGKQAQKETSKTGKAKAGQATVNQVCCLLVCRVCRVGRFAGPCL